MLAKVTMPESDLTFKQLISDFNVHEFNPYTIVPPFNMIARI